MSKVKSRHDIEKEVVEKAHKDPEFRKKFFANPKSTLKELFKDKKELINILNSLKVNIYEEKKNEWTIAMPYLGKSTSVSEADLEKMAAARDCANVWMTD